jgi:hypothetical protein
LIPFYLKARQFRTESEKKTVIPAKAGIQLCPDWIPAFAGMTHLFFTFTISY